MDRFDRLAKDKQLCNRMFTFTPIESHRLICRDVYIALTSSISVKDTNAAVRVTAGRVG
jgi:hypothetical protein